MPHTPTRHDDVGEAQLAGEGDPPAEEQRVLPSELLHVPPQQLQRDHQTWGREGWGREGWGREWGSGRHQREDSIRESTEFVVYLISVPVQTYTHMSTHRDKKVAVCTSHLPARCRTNKVMCERNKWNVRSTA